MIARGALAAVLALAAGVAAGHEFWIQPIPYQVAPGDQMTASLRVGQNFKGATYPYVPRNFVRFDAICGGHLAAVQGRPGDRPALNVQAGEAGLCVIVHQTRDYTLTYSDWEKFEGFLRHKDNAWALAAHDARGLSHENVRERYSRYAKSLISVGEGQGADQEVGILVEIVAEANPYTDDVSRGFPVRVLYEGQPRANSQVELFEKDAEGNVSSRFFRTDDAGRTLLEVRPGRQYLVDSVVLRPLEPETANGPVWESLWGSLTFAVPPLR